LDSCQDYKDFSTVYGVKQVARKVHTNRVVNITASQIKAEWDTASLRRKTRSDRGSRFFGRVRGIFIFLFVATIFVFSFNRRTEIQSLAFAEVHQALKHPIISDRLRQNAINYERQVDEIAQ
jgi:hypothetical protein